MAKRQPHEIIPSGKYKGWSLSQVPNDYISWLSTYGKSSSLWNWYCGNKKKKAKSRHQVVGGNQPAQGAKTGPVHSSKIYRVITKEDGTTIRIEYPGHGSHT